MKTTTILLSLLFLLLSLYPQHCYSASLFPNKFDDEIKSSAKRYLPLIDWRLYKAQLWQESRFKDRAVSPVGASGVAQFMPDTWEYVAHRLGLVGSPFDTDLAIKAGAYYMAQQRAFWSSPRPEDDRHRLALCNYNAGGGNCLRAQIECNNAVYYNEIITCLPLVTGHHAKETIDYVVYIYGFFSQMVIHD